MTTRLIAAAGLLGFLGVAPLTAAAQDAGRAGYRQGFWIGFGLAAGHAQIDCVRCGPRPVDGPWDGGPGYTAYLAMGGTPRPDLLVGGEINGYGAESPSGREAVLGGGGVVVQYYPVPASRVYLKGAAGYGSVVLSGPAGMGGETFIESLGFSLQAGAGYDILLTDRFALVPFASVLQIVARSAEGRNNGDVVRGPSNPRYLQFGLGFHWY